jgi:hypothetical protein
MDPRERLVRECTGPKVLPQKGEERGVASRWIGIQSFVIQMGYKSAVESFTIFRIFCSVMALCIKQQLIW